MPHAGRNVDHIVLANCIGLFLDRQRALAALDDIDVVSLGVVVMLAARATRHQPVEMHVDLLGAERWIDELDLLATPRLHRIGRALIQMEYLEQRYLLRALPRL